ncbi:MAG: hypothetical protein ACRDFC_00925 [Ignavibacteria bacterium]
MNNFIIISFIILSASNVYAQSNQTQNTFRGRDFLTPADFNFPVRIYAWEVSGDEPFIDKNNNFKIGLFYNYSSAEKYFDSDGEKGMVKESFNQYNKPGETGGYFRKHGAVVFFQYSFAKLNKLVIRFPFTFTEMKSYSSTTDVKPQPEFIKPRGPFQDIEISYTRKINIGKKTDLYGGLGISLPTSRPKRYLDNPHGGNGNTWTTNLNAYVSYKLRSIRITAGAKYLLKLPHSEELYTPRPFGIGYPFLYDTANITAEQMNNYIEQNPYEAGIESGSQIIADGVFDYITKIGFSATLHFQYFNSTGDKFDKEIPFEFARVNGNITAIKFINELDGGSIGIIRIYLNQNFEKIAGAKFDFTLGYGQSLFGKNAQGEANILMGIRGYF